MRQPVWLVLCFQILALLLTYCQNTFSDKIPAQMKTPKFLPQDDFWKISGTFWKLSSKCSYHCSSCQRQSIKLKYLKGWGGGGELFQVTSNIFKSIKPKKTNNKKIEYLEETWKTKINYECWSNAVQETTKRDAIEHTKM